MFCKLICAIQMYLCGDAIASMKQVSEEQYPHHRFWEIAKDVGNTAIIGVDAHDNHSLDMETNWNEAVHYLDEVLEIKRVDHMEMKGF